MKVKDLFTTELECADVYENIADEIGIAFDCAGNDPLTDEGKKYFKVALNMEVKAIRNGMIVIDTEKHCKDKGINLDNYDFESRDSIPKDILKLIDLFWAYAGYCSTEEWNKWFKQ